MPHDCKGRLIEVGDHVKMPVWDAKLGGYRASVGRVGTVMEGAKSCNVIAYHLVPGFAPVREATVTASECELLLRADGSEPEKIGTAPGNTPGNPS